MNQKNPISIKHSFHIIQGVVCLVLVFLIVQGCVLWRMCDRGAEATTGLEQGGLPSLRLLAAMHSGLAAYRLRAYEMIFAHEKDRPGKMAEAETALKTNLETLAALKQLYPTGEGHEYVAALQTNFEDYVKMMAQIRDLIEKDFDAGIKQLDTEGPGKAARLEEAVKAVTTYCDQVASEHARLTVDSFSRVRTYVVMLDSANIGFALLAAGLVAFNSNRVRRTLNALAETLGEVSYSLIGSAGAITSSSQILAEGSSQQASSLEETSASLEDMASVTKHNAENAQKANELSRYARNAAEKGATDMQSMSGAMQDIKHSSDEIAKIIRTIDEIAFQTNILALNAAVEAARAGESGMGFAVVADEVRNLAQRSAQAAKETAAKIEDAINNTARGVQITNKVSEALNEIVNKSRQVDELAAEVAGTSREQTQGITQINAAVANMDKVTQNNAASAEESAAAAMELNGQAKAMKAAVENLLRLVGQDSLMATGQATPTPERNGMHHNGNDSHMKKKGPGGARREEIPLENGFRDF